MGTRPPTPHLRLWRADLILSILAIWVSVTRGQSNTFTWDFVGASTLPECGTSTIRIINTKANGSGGSGSGPYTMFSYQPGGTTVASPLVGTDLSSLQWVVPHPAGSQVFLQVADSRGNSGGIAGSLFTVAAGASTTCHNTPAASLKIATTSTSLQTCDPLVLDFSGGTKPYTLSIIAQNSNVVTNFTMGPEDNEFTWINRAPPGAPLIVAAHDATGTYGLNTPLIPLSGSSDATCGTKNSLSGVQGASVSSTILGPGQTPAPSASQPAPSGSDDSGSSDTNSLSASTDTSSPTDSTGVVSPSAGSSDVPSSASLPPGETASSSSPPLYPTDPSSPTDNPSAITLPSSRPDVAAIAGGTVAAVVLIIALVTVFMMVHLRRKRAAAEEELAEIESISWGRVTATAPNSRRVTRTTAAGVSPVEERSGVNPFISPATYRGFDWERHAPKPPPVPPVPTIHIQSPATTSPTGPPTGLTKRQLILQEQRERDRQNSPISPQTTLQSHSNYSSPTTTSPSPTNPFRHPYATANPVKTPSQTRPPSSAGSSEQDGSQVPLLQPPPQPTQPQQQEGRGENSNRSPFRATIATMAPILQHRDGGPVEIPPPYNYL